MCCWDDCVRTITWSSTTIFLPQAVKHLEKLLQLIPDDFEALVLLADVYERLGEPQRAVKRLENQLSSVMTLVRDHDMLPMCLWSHAPTILSATPLFLLFLFRPTCYTC